MFAVAAAVTVLASTAYAQSLNISSQCQSAITNIAASSDGTCLNAAGLAANFVTLNANSSIVGPVDSWLKGLCSEQACSNQTLANIVGNITSGCASDLSSLGFSSSDESTVVSEVQQFYPTVREVVCLKNSTSNNLCVTDLLTDIQNSAGTLSENNIGNIIVSALGGSQALENVLKNAACSNCVKAAYNVIQQNFGSLISANDKANLTSTCGSNFTDGSNPSDVTQTAAGLSTSNNSNGALTSFPLTSLTVAVSGLASMFAFFA